MDMISLDDAAKLLLGDGKHTSMTTRSNVPLRLVSVTSLDSSNERYKNTFIKTVFVCKFAAKVRRLYDIANVLASMKFIEKVIHLMEWYSKLSTIDFKPYITWSNHSPG